MNKKELNEMRSIINESFVNKTLFDAIENINNKKIPSAVAKFEKAEGKKLTKAKQNKIDKAIDLLDSAWTLLRDVLE